MKIRSGTNVWYLLVLIALAIVFILAGIKYLDKGEVSHQQADQDPTSPSTNADSNGVDDTDNPNLSTDQQFATKGADSMSKGDYATAIDYFAKAIAANPNDTSYYSLKSQAEVLAGKSSDAKATLEAGLKVDPGNELLNSKLDVLNNADNLAPANQENPKL